MNKKVYILMATYNKKYLQKQIDSIYPIFTDNNQEKYNKYLEYSKQWKNLILLGRLAEYKYYDMDDMTERALKIFKEIIND